MAHAKNIEPTDETVAEIPRPPWASKEVDQRIIDCLVADDLAVLGDLMRSGVSEESIRARARGLGVTGEFLKRCRLSGSRPAIRTCVKCDDRFLSSGIHNRLCRRCQVR